MRDVRLSELLMALLLTAIAAMGIVALLTLLGPDWAQYGPATCTATRCFCETPRIGSLIVQPANSWSSYGYVFAGFLMIAISGRADWNSAFAPSAARIFGITAIVVGLGSVLLHATLTIWGQFVDVLGMYLVGSFMLIGALARWRNIAPARAMLLYALLCAALVTVLIVMPEVRRWLFAALLLTAIAVELIVARPLRPGVQLRYYLFGIVAKAIGFSIWILDQRGTLCMPESLLQGHALWHLCGALSIWLTFSYYRSERRQAAGTP